MSIHWLIVLAGLFAFLQGGIYRRWALRRLSYSRSFSTQACYEGDEVQLVEVIANRKALPLPWLRLESLMQAGLQFHSQSNLAVNSGGLFQNHRSLFSLMPYTQITRKHRVRCLRRGCYTLQTATLTCGDLFGFSSVFTTYRFGADTRLLVYPKPVPFGEVPLPSHSWQGEMSVRRWIVDDPFRIAGVREYRYGDPLNAVNWKATARSGRLQVHNRDFTADHRLLLWLNFDITEEMWNAVTDPERIERGIRYAAALAEYAISRGIDTGFGCNGRLADGPKEPVRLAPAGGRAQLIAIYEAMALLEIERSVGFDTFLEQEAERGLSDTDIILFTPYMSPKLERLLERIKRGGNAVEIVMLAAEEMRNSSSAAGSSGEGESA